jgi:hypothetical protein
MTAAQPSVPSITKLPGGMISRRPPRLILQYGETKFGTSRRVQTAQYDPDLKVLKPSVPIGLL